MKKQSIWVFQWRKSVHYWWSYILFSPECKELTSMLDPLLYRWGVPPVVIRCVHWTMQMWVLQTWIKALGLYIVMVQLTSSLSSSQSSSSATPNTSSPCVFVSWVNARQATFTDITLKTCVPFILGLPLPLVPGILKSVTDLIRTWPSIHPSIHPPILRFRCTVT